MPTHGDCQPPERRRNGRIATTWALSMSTGAYAAAPTLVVFRCHPVAAALLRWAPELDSARSCGRPALDG